MNPAEQQIILFEVLPQYTSFYYYINIREANIAFEFRLNVFYFSNQRHGRTTTQV